MTITMRALIAFFIAAGLSNGVQAFCTTGTQHFYPMPAVISVDNTASLPIRGVIHTQSSQFGDLPWWYQCTLNYGDTYTVSAQGRLIGGGIHASSDPRVGLRITWGGKSVPYTGRAQRGIVTKPSSFYAMFPAERFAPMVVELIKLSDIDSPITLSGVFARLDVPGIGQPVATISFEHPVTVMPPTPPTCSPASARETLEPVSIARFTGVGSTAGQKGFNLDLYCAGGDVGTRAAVQVTLADAARASNTSDRLTLAGNSTAQGVGVQVLRNGQPLRFGATAPGNPWDAGMVPGGLPRQLRIPLAVRYVQTAPQPRAGTVRAAATVTLSYR